MSIMEACLSDSENRTLKLLIEAQAGSNSSLGQLLQGYSAYLNLLASEELGFDITVKASASDLVQSRKSASRKSAIRPVESSR